MLGLILFQKNRKDEKNLHSRDGQYGTLDL